MRGRTEAPAPLAARRAARAQLVQSGDLAVLDRDPAVAAAIPHLLSLRSAIYSPAFRQFIQARTHTAYAPFELAPFTPRVSLSVSGGRGLAGRVRVRAAI